MVGRGLWGIRIIRLGIEKLSIVIIQIKGVLSNLQGLVQLLVAHRFLIILKSAPFISRFGIIIESWLFDLNLV